MNFIGNERQTKPVIPYQNSGGCKVKIIKKSRHDHTVQSNRKPWDLSQFCDNSSSTKTVSQVFSCRVPTPDYTLLPAKQVNVFSGGNVQEKDVILCCENWKPAVWACGPQHRLTVEQSHKWGRGISKRFVKILPNRYRLFDQYGSDDFNESDKTHTVERPIICEMIGGASIPECMRICQNDVCAGTYIMHP